MQELSPATKKFIDYKLVGCCRKNELEYRYEAAVDYTKKKKKMQHILLVKEE